MRIVLKISLNSLTGHAFQKRDHDVKKMRAGRSTVLTAPLLYNSSCWHPRLAANGLASRVTVAGVTESAFVTLLTVAILVANLTVIVTINSGRYAKFIHPQVISWLYKYMYRVILCISSFFPTLFYQLLWVSLDFLSQISVCLDLPHHLRFAHQQPYHSQSYPTISYLLFFFFNLQRSFPLPLLLLPFPLSSRNMPKPFQPIPSHLVHY